jgi:PadR family transcriptional regulator AphA
MSAPPLSLTEWAVLGLLAEQPAHGFAISKLLQVSGAVGKILTVRRPLVYRALDRLADLELIEPAHTEPGVGGPHRTIYRVTRRGRRRLDGWLSEPVAHVRDLRIEFQLKLALLVRTGRSPLDLIRTQRLVLEPTLGALDSGSEGGIDHLELWRRHMAVAAARYLEDLESRY